MLFLSEFKILWRFSILEHGAKGSFSPVLNYDKDKECIHFCLSERPVLNLRLIIIPFHSSKVIFYWPFFRYYQSWAVNTIFFLHCICSTFGTHSYRSNGMKCSCVQFHGNHRIQVTVYSLYFGITQEHDCFTPYGFLFQLWCVHYRKWSIIL